MKTKIYGRRKAAAKLNSLYYNGPKCTICGKTKRYTSTASCAYCADNAATLRSCNRSKEGHYTNDSLPQVTPYNIKMAEDKDSFLQYVVDNSTVQENGCIHWHGPWYYNGLPKSRVGKTHNPCSTKRLIYEFKHGVTLENNMLITTTCHDKNCVNVDHFRLVEKRDIITKKQKLTLAIWEDVFVMNKQGFKQYEIAEKHGLTQAMISLILNGIAKKPKE